MILGNDLRKFIVDGKKDEANEVLRIVTNNELIAIDQDKLGKQAKRVVKGNEYDVLAKPLTDGVAICLFNRSQKAAKKIAFDINALKGDDYFSFAAQKEYVATNVKTGERISTAGVIERELPPCGVAVYKIVRA